MSRQTEILHKTTQGYICKVSGTPCYQVGFGNLLIELDRCTLQRVREDLNAIIFKYRDRDLCEGQHFLFRTEARNVCLILNYAEVILLENILDKGLWIENVLNKLYE